jgi:tetratricopeptide (TPR) repeat protein
VHALNAGLLFALLRLMTGAVWRSLLVAGLFSLHPLHVESVAWVAERKDVLSGFFGLLALIAYARYAQGRMQNAECRMQKSAAANALHVSRFTFHVSTFYLLSLLCFALGLMSKPMLVTWPFVMLLLDYWPLGRMQKAAASDTQHASRFTFHVSRSTLLPLLVEKIPFFVLTAVFSIVTFRVQRQAGALVDNEISALDARVANAVISYGRYLGKLFWPANLAVVYPNPGRWPLGLVLLAVALMLGLSVWFWAQRRRYPFALMGWLWYCGTLVPVIQVLQTGGHAMADRYSYLPCLGILILTVWGVGELTRNWGRRVSAIAGSAAIVLCLALTRHQLGYWKDSETLFQHALEVTENNNLAHNNVGDALYKRGQIDEAMRHYQEAVRLKPNYADALNNMGNVFYGKGQNAEAIHQYQEALRFKPDHVLAHDNLGIALGREGRMSEAIPQFQEAIRLKPDCIDAHYNLGVALAGSGRVDEAILHFHEALRLQPSNAQACSRLAVALAGQGQIDEAIGQFREALRLKPDDPEAHYGLAVALANKGQMSEAISEYQQTASLKPDDPQVHNNLGTALYQQGRTGEAIQHFQEALRLKPDFAAASKNLAIALAATVQSPPPPAGASTNR